MKKITINIPDGLSSLEEAHLIKDKLVQKALSGTGKNRDQKRIGDRVKVGYTETTIVIKRDVSDHIETVKCNACGCDYQSDMFKRIYINYGGRTKELRYCSEDCCKTVIDICGPGRARFKKKDLKFTHFMCSLLFVLLSWTASSQKFDDKAAHFLVNSHGVPLIGITAFQYGYSQPKSILLGASVMTAVSLGKEVADKQRGGRFSWEDISYDARGIVAGAFITLVVNGLIQHYRDNRAAEKAYRNYKPVQF